MGMRESLIELLKTACPVEKKCKSDCFGCMADHLIDNGVTIKKYEEIDFDYAAED